MILDRRIEFSPDVQTYVTIDVKIAQIWILQGPKGGKTTSLSVMWSGVDLTKFWSEAGDGWLVAPDDVLAPDRKIVRDVLRRDDQLHVLAVLVSDSHRHQDTAQRNQGGGVGTIKLEPDGELMPGVGRAGSDHAVSLWSLLLPPDWALHHVQAAQSRQDKKN